MEKVTDQGDGGHNGPEGWPRPCQENLSLSQRSEEAFQLRVLLLLSTRKIRQLGLTRRGLPALPMHRKPSGLIPISVLSSLAGHTYR